MARQAAEKMPSSSLMRNRGIFLITDGPGDEACEQARAGGLTPTFKLCPSLPEGESPSQKPSLGKRQPDSGLRSIEFTTSAGRVLRGRYSSHTRHGLVTSQGALGDGVPARTPPPTNKALADLVAQMGEQPPKTARHRKQG